MVVEQPFHDRLAVVEGAFDGKCMNIWRGCRRHHAPLHFGDAAVREQYDQINIGAVGECVDRSAAGVARGCDDDRGALASL